MVVCPGQGSQRSDITDTAVVQPLIVSTSLRSYRGGADLVAGHSVGMLTAFAIAGAFDFESAIQLATIRGRLFSEVTSPPHPPGGMSALIGKNVLAQFEALHSGLQVAVVNSDSQIVVAGPLAALANLAAIVPRGVRVNQLAVSGAFHTEAMQGAVAGLAEALTKTKIKDPTIPVISDLTGELFTGGEHGCGAASDIVSHLIAQITNPVRWDLVSVQIKSQISSGDEIFEAAPSGTLSGLLKRELDSEHVELKSL